MTFTVKQLVEKAIEHHTKQFLIFVDLRLTTQCLEKV